MKRVRFDKKLTVHTMADWLQASREARKVPECLKFVIAVALENEF